MAENTFKADWPSFALGFNTGKSKGGSGGGAELNIHYSLDTPPEDTTKIWVKSPKPEKVRVEPLAFNEVTDYPFSVVNHRVSRACVAVGDKIYMFGGYSNINSTTGTSSVYDTVTKEAKNIANMPRWGTVSRAVLYGNIVHVFAGANWLAYHLDSNSWGTVSTSVNSDIQGSACCLVDGFVYFFGGGKQEKNTIYKLNLETQELIKCEATLSSSRYYVSCAAIGTKIYLFGGRSSSYSVSKAECYDTTNDTISAIKSMPVENRDMGCLAYGDDILLLGGYRYTSKSNEYLDKVMIYKPSTDEYLLGDGVLTRKRMVEGCVMVGGKIYLMCVATTDYDNEIEIFYVQPPVENGTLAMNLRTSGTKIPIINGETVHIDTNIGGTYIGDENGVGQPVEALMFKDGEWANI